MTWGLRMRRKPARMMRSISWRISVDSSAFFALTASVIYYFAGFSPGVHCIILLTALGVFLNILRHNYLKKSFFSVVLCALLGLLTYELLCFFFALFVEQTSLRRIGIACMTCLLTGAVLPILYPIFVSIGKIGGETWKE